MRNRLFQHESIEMVEEEEKIRLLVYSSTSVQNRNVE